MKLLNEVRYILKIYNLYFVQ